MPADALYLCGVSPPFAYDNEFMNIHSRTKTFYSNSCRVINPQSFSRAPHLTLKGLKPCLKLIQQTDAVCGYTEVKKVFQETVDQRVESITVEDSENVLKKCKKVTFADTQGRSLTYVKYLTESTNEPPKSFNSCDVARDMKEHLNITSSTSCKKSKDATKLLLKFDQPVANYMDFQRKINMNNVSLENVVIKNNTVINGTVKVKNIAFDKCVIVKVTFNDWRTSEDIKCEYVKNAYENGKFDTFQFNLSIPNSNETDQSYNIQFCICFECNGKEFWDNNNGENYIISCTIPAIAQMHSSLPVKIPPRSCFKNHSRFPSTYTELPGPQDCVWLNMEGAGPFY